MTRPPAEITEALRRLAEAGDELLAIATAALLQDAVDREIGNDSIREWEAARKAALAAAAPAPASPDEPSTDNEMADINREMEADLWNSDR